MPSAPAPWDRASLPRGAVPRGAPGCHASFPPLRPGPTASERRGCCVRALLAGWEGVRPFKPTPSTGRLQGQGSGLQNPQERELQSAAEEARAEQDVGGTGWVCTKAWPGWGARAQAEHRCSSPGTWPASEAISSSAARLPPASPPSVVTQPLGKVAGAL